MKNFNLMLAHVSATLLVALLLAIALAAQGVFAQERDIRPGIYAGGLGYVFSEERDLDADPGFMVGGELPFSRRWSGLLEYWQVDTEFDNSSLDADMRYLRLGGNFYLAPGWGDWQPYLSAGAGYLQIDPQNGSTESEPAIDLGVGIKRHFSNNLTFRGDIKTVHGNEEGAFDLGIGFTVGYTFGGGTPPVVPPPRAATTSAPVVEVTDGDADRDGVLDSRDDCPATDTNLAVDDSGCPILEMSQRRQELLINFEFDKDEILPQYLSAIAEFADFMQQYANTSVVIEGHTDNIGTDEYNQDLAERRANAIRNVLIERHGIAPERLSVAGFGASRPIADNSSAEGRERNRRIEAAVSVEV
ncbi:MAG: OmpA family protein [Pseudomonadales bacterium]|nr:OmpA family protein [Pseudomonadales bacterium]